MKSSFCAACSPVWLVLSTQSEVIIRPNLSGLVFSVPSNGHRAPALRLTAFTQYCARALPQLLMLLKYNMADGQYFQGEQGSHPPSRCQFFCRLLPVPQTFQGGNMYQINSQQRGLRDPCPCLLSNQSFVILVFQPKPNWIQQPRQLPVIFQPGAPAFTGDSEILSSRFLILAFGLSAIIH